MTTGKPTRERGLVDILALVFIAILALTRNPGAVIALYRIGGFAIVMIGSTLGLVACGVGLGWPKLAR